MKSESTCKEFSKIYQTKLRMLECDPILLDRENSKRIADKICNLSIHSQLESDHTLKVAYDSQVNRIVEMGINYEDNFTIIVE